MDKLNRPIRRLKHIFIPSAPTTLGNGWTSSPLLSFTTTPSPIAPLKFPPSPCYMGMNLMHTHPWKRSFLGPALENHLTTLKEAWKEALAAHETAHRIMKEQNTWNFSPWKVGDKVWLEAMNLHLNYPSRKLAPKWQGPFEMSQVLFPLTYCLHLPATWKIHDVFHAFLLSSYKKTAAHGPNFSKPPPDLIGTKEEYEVDWIVSHWSTSGHCKYLTTWKGYPLSENIWEPKSNLWHALEILSTYKQTHQLSYLTTTTCPSFQHMITPFPSNQPTFLGSWDLLSTNSSSFDYETSPLTTPKPISTSARSSGAPSTTECAGSGISL